MTRIVVFYATLAALVGCATTGGSNSPVEPHKVGSGSINSNLVETVNLTTGDVYSQALYIGSVDSVSVDLFAASGTGACTVTPEVSDRFNPSTDSNSDTTKWTTYAPSGWTAPAALTGAVSGYIINANPILEYYWHVHYHCTSGTTTLTQATQRKGS